MFLYLIRHGEAEHNIREKAAMKKARLASLKEDGLPEDHPVTKQRMDEARRAVLNDENLKDAKLSALGRREAEEARDELKALIAKQQQPLAEPDYILVSPLTRTLETADIIFPDHRGIHVREDLAERRTGKPPDTRSPVSHLELRASFQRFSMLKLREASKGKLREAKSENSSSIPEMMVMQGDLWDRFERQEYSLDEPLGEEDKEELRKRTERLFVLLCEADSDRDSDSAIAVVTHKGYLRELERGPFGQPDATEFRNCEIRAYRVTVSMEGYRLVKAERVH